MKPGSGESPIKRTFSPLLKLSSERRRTANAGNVSFRISLRWPIQIINPVDKTKLYVMVPEVQSSISHFKETQNAHIFVLVNCYLNICAFHRGWSNIFKTILSLRQKNSYILDTMRNTHDTEAMFFIHTDE